ncbi:hypothetical protein QR680_006595 [Steinernema hermaphroditum]|uniref:Uncharacterized protein n=1 Tax=Steinernema hermaphroditum TaxID=289476 RepID=A0AA39HYB2_9BILA|nr:hypothetical protein QR680_006595 [Steinernema hermaphroditum]
MHDKHFPHITAQQVQLLELKMNLLKRRFLERREAKREEKREKRAETTQAASEPPKIYDRSLKQSYSYQKSLQHNDAQKVIDKHRRNQEMDKLERNNCW